MSRGDVDGHDVNYLIESYVECRKKTGQNDIINRRRVDAIENDLTMAELQMDVLDGQGQISHRARRY